MGPRDRKSSAIGKIRSTRDILRRFRAATGLPVLVNTSFNVHEEPIVNQPSECLKALREGRVDFAVTERAVYTN